MMLDYHRLPPDFPGMDSRPQNGSPWERLTHVETAIAKHFDPVRNFIPFLALHEFEAWLFSSPIELPRVMTEPQKQKQFEAIRAGVKPPEEINERPQSAPSKQIETLFPAFRKTLHGPTVASRIGLAQIRGECPHFDDWVKKWEALGCDFK